MGWSRGSGGHQRQGWQGRLQRGVSEQGERRHLVDQEKMMKSGWRPRVTGTRDLGLTYLWLTGELGGGVVRDFGGPEGQPHENVLAYQGLPPPPNLGVPRRV